MYVDARAQMCEEGMQEWGVAETVAARPAKNIEPQQATMGKKLTSQLEFIA